MDSISQICVVSRDLEATMKAYTETLGWGPWSVFEHKHPTLHDTYYRGEPEPFEMLAAETDVEGLGFEIIQPIKGRNIYQEFLDEKGEGLQHVAIMKKTPEDAEAFMNNLSAPIIMSGRIGEHIQFFYLDTQDTLKVCVETGTGHAIDVQPTRFYG